MSTVFARSHRRSGAGAEWRAHLVEPLALGSLTSLRAGETKAVTADTYVLGAYGHTLDADRVFFDDNPFRR